MDCISLGSTARDGIRAAMPATTRRSALRSSPFASFHLGTSSSWRNLISLSKFDKNTVKFQRDPKSFAKKNGSQLDHRDDIFSQLPPILRSDWQWELCLQLRPGVRAGGKRDRFLFSRILFKGQFGVSLKIGGTESRSLFLMRHSGGQETVAYVEQALRPLPPFPVLMLVSPASTSQY